MSEKNQNKPAAEVPAAVKPAKKLQPRVAPQQDVPLAVAEAAIEKKPAVVETPEGDTIAIRHKMYLSLSYDHRIVNGAMGGAFLRRIADYLENWNG